MTPSSPWPRAPKKAKTQVPTCKTLLKLAPYIRRRSGAACNSLGSVAMNAFGMLCYEKVAIGCIVNNEARREAKAKFQFGKRWLREHGKQHGFTR